MNPSVSIVVPIYNVEKYLDRCVKSLLDQTYNNLEIILVDDGSPDKSPKMCDEYAEINPRIKVIHKPNGGLSDARNAGLEVSTGEYVMFIDSDDYVETNMVETLMNTINQEKSDVVIFGYYADYVNHDEQLLSTRSVRPMSGHYTNKTFKDIPIDGDMVGLFGYAWNKIYKKEVITSNNLKFTKGISLVEDIMFNGPLLMKCNKISFIDDVFVHYMQRPRATLGNKFYENYFELKLMAIESVSNLLKSWNKSSEIIERYKENAKYTSLKSTIRFLSDAHNYSLDEKIKYLKKLFLEKDVEALLSNLQVKGFKDKVIKVLIKTKKYKLLLKLYKKKK